MTGLVRKATMIGACALMVASTALATPVPSISPTKSTWLDWRHPSPTDPASNLDHPQYIDVVTTNGLTIDPFNSQVTLRLADLANNPISAASVRIDFSRACDFRLCSVEGAGMTLAGNVVSGVTDARGEITFRLAGGADGNAFLPTDPHTSKGAKAGSHAAWALGWVSRSGIESGHRAPLGPDSTRSSASQPEPDPAAAARKKSHLKQDS